MPLKVRDALALLIVGGAALTSIVVWNHGEVSLGMQLTEADGQVRVADVTPDSNAAWNYWSPGIRVLDVTTSDGSEVRRGETLRAERNALESAYDPPFGAYDPAFRYPDAGPVPTLSLWHRPPIDAVESSRIQTAVGGELGTPDFPEVFVFAMLDRTLLELELRSSIWLLAFGAALGVLVWRLLHHGVAGSVGRELAVVLGSAAAAPFLVLPIVEAGTTAGIIAGFLIPAAVALILGLALARQHPEASWRQTATAGSVVAAGLAVVLLVRYMTAPVLTTGDRGGVVLMIAAIALVPALIAVTAASLTGRHRLSVISLSLLPAAAQTIIGPRPDAIGPMALIGLLLGWQLLPVERALPAIGQRLSGIGGGGPLPDSVTVGGVSARARDLMALGFFAVVSFWAIVAGYDTWAVIAALAVAGLVGVSVRRGFLGPSWTDAAVPLAVAVGTPIALVAFSLPFGIGAWGTLLPTALAGLGVAHVLACRYPDPSWGNRLMLGSAGVVAVVWVLSLAHGWELALLLVAVVALVPGLPLAYAPMTDDARAVSNRLETMVVALTPAAAAATTVVPIGFVVLVAWLLALVIWRYFTLAPLLRVAQRTQLQRDVAVAAAETERARLAADLHDDALQQLTMLVRRLDERGDTETADEAREIAAKLRGVVGDLRLPILDDLGAGAALEWLVERVEPLAGGPVKLERSDPTRPPATVELAVFRVAQEALTNAIKHGRPPIEVRYDVRSDGRVTLAIDDAGEGIASEAADEAPHQGHFGLVTMQQRAEQIGALLDVRRWPGGGTRVALEWRPMASR